MKKKPRHDMEPAAGPLLWLADFANVGLDRTQARGPVERLKESRFLGLAGQRGYLLDPEIATEINVNVRTPDGFSLGDLVTQRRRGITLQWLRRDGKEYAVPRQLANTDTLRLDLIPRTRSIMPVPSERVRWTLPIEALSEQRALSEVQSVIRSVLKFLWYLNHGLNLRECSFLLLWILEAIGQTCLGRTSEPRVFDSRADKETEVLVRAAEGWASLVFENRAPVWISARSFVADALPGIAWAEVLNLLMTKDGLLAHTLAMLQWCSWCGAFWLLPSRGRGRPRKFCSDACRIRFHDYAPEERRK